MKKNSNTSKKTQSSNEWNASIILPSTILRPFFLVDEIVQHFLGEEKKTEFLGESEIAKQKHCKFFG